MAGEAPSVAERLGAQGTLPEAVREQMGRQLRQALANRRSPQQMALLDLPAMVETPAEGAESPADERTGPGRRPGSRNRRTSDIAEFIQQNYGDPLVFAAQLYSTPLPLLLIQVAEAIGWAAGRGLTGEEMKLLLGKAIDLLRIQASAAADVAPYVHSKMPVRVIDESERGITPVVFLAPELAARMAGQQGGWDFAKWLENNNNLPFDPVPLDNDALDKTLIIEPDQQDSTAPAADPLSDQSTAPLASPGADPADGTGFVPEAEGSPGVARGTTEAPGGVPPKAAAARVRAPSPHGPFELFPDLPRPKFLNEDEPGPGDSQP